MRSRAFVRGAAALMVAALAACDSPEERLESHYERGRELVEDGRAEQAQLEFRNALRINPDHGPSRLALGRIAEEAGDFGAAVGHYRVASEADQSDAESRVLLSRILVAGGALDEARDVVDAALEIAPDSARARAVNAALLLRVGDPEGAVEQAEAALSIDPDLLDAKLVLISERVQAGDRGDALARLDAVIADGAPEDERQALDVLRLNILSGAGDADAIEAQLRAMADRYPDELRFRGALAQLLLGQGDLEGAKGELRVMAQAARDDAGPAIDLVRLILRDEGPDAADAELRAQIDAASPGTRRVDLQLARTELLLQTDRGEEARDMLEDMIAGDDGEAAARARIALARLALADGASERARALVADTLEEDAENVEALALRARIAIDDYRPEDAIADLRRARQGDPENPRLMLLEAQAHERSGNMSLAGERLAAATRASDYAPGVSATYVGFLRSRGELAAAESVLSEVARRNPTDAGVLTQLAELRLRLEDWSGAEEAATALRRLQNGEVAAAQVTAAALSGQGRFNESTALLQQLNEAVGDDDATVANLVANYVRAGERERAIGFLEDLLADNPGNRRALLLRAELHVLDGEDEQAIERLDALIDAFPDEQLGYLAKSRLLLGRGRNDEAAAVAEAGIAAVGQAPALQLIVAQRREAENDFEQAIEIYRGLYESNPDSVLYANNLVSLLAEHREDDAESIAFAKRVARRLRGYDVPHLQDTYGWVQFLAGDYDEALRSLQPAAEGLPDNPLVRYHLGRTYAEIGEVGSAREHLEAALALDPDFPKAASAREALAGLETGTPGQ